MQLENEQAGWQAGRQTYRHTDSHLSSEIRQPDGTSLIHIPHPTQIVIGQRSYDTRQRLL